MFNSLPNDKYVDLSKWKAFADNSFSVAQMIEFVFDREEILWEKEKMLVTSIFSFFHSIFKTLFPLRPPNLKRSVLFWNHDMSTSSEENLVLTVFVYLQVTVSD